MCPQNPSLIVQEYRREQRLLMNLREIIDFAGKISDIEREANTITTETDHDQECEDLIKKLEECKFCIIGESPIFS